METKNELIKLQEKTGIVFEGALANDYSIAKIFVESGFFKDTKSASMAMVKIIAGREIGLQPFTSMKQIHIFPTSQGTAIQVGSNIIASKINLSKKYKYKIVKATKTECSIDFYELIDVGTWDLLGNYTYTIDDAKSANLINKNNWKTNPKDMLFNRAMSGGYKMFCPDIFEYSVYTEADGMGEKPITSDLNNDIAEAEVIYTDEIEKPATSEVNGIYSYYETEDVSKLIDAIMDYERYPEKAALTNYLYDSTMELLKHHAGENVELLLEKLTGNKKLSDGLDAMCISDWLSSNNDIQSEIKLILGVENGNS